MKISSEDLFLRREAVGFNWRKFYPWEELSVTERSPKWDRMDSVDYIYMKYNINTRKHTWDDRELRPPFQSVHCIGFSGYIHIDYRTYIYIAFGVDAQILPDYYSKWRGFEGTSDRKEKNVTRNFENHYK